MKKYWENTSKWILQTPEVFPNSYTIINKSQIIR